MIAYKFLTVDGTSPFTRFQWPLPNGGAGAWVEAAVAPCRSGIHACRQRDLPFWVGRRLFEIELAGDVVDEPSKVVASRGRLLRQVTRWDDDLRDAYTRACADRAHELARDATPLLDGWEEVVEPSIAEGPALLGFIAARMAEEASGRDAYHAERATQTEWLVERLGLEP